MSARKAAKPDNVATLREELARLALGDQAGDPGLRGRVFGYAQGSAEDRASYALLRKEEAQSHAQAMEAALKLIGPPVPQGVLPPFIEQSVEQRIVHGEDCANYRGRREVVCGLVRQALERLAHDVDRDHMLSIEQARENILAAFVMEVERDLHWRDRQQQDLDHTTGHPRAVDVAPARALLDEFLVAFDVAHAPGAQLFADYVRAMWDPEADHAKMRADLHRRGPQVLVPKAEELDAAAPLLRDLTTAARDLRGEAMGRAIGRFMALRKPREYAEEHRAIRFDWNGAVLRNGWSSLPLLCTECGTPILLRGVERLRGGGTKRAELCSPDCRAAVGSRRRAETRRRKQGPRGHAKNKKMPTATR